MLVTELLSTFKSQNLAKKIYDLWLLVSLALLGTSSVSTNLAEYTSWILLPAAVVGIWVRVVVYLKG